MHPFLRNSLITLVAVTPLAAQAAISTGLNNSNGELFFIAYDPLSTNTFVKDLGYDFSVLAANSASTSWFTTINLGSLVSPGVGEGKFNFGSGTLWNLAAQNRVSSGHTRGNNGVFTTVNVSKSSDLFNTQNTQAFGGLGTNTNNANNRLGSLQTAISNKVGFLNQSFSDAANPNKDLDLDFVALDTDTQSYNSVWGGNLGGSAIQFITEGSGVDDALAFYYFFRASNPTTINREEQAGLFRLSSAGVLTYGVIPPAPVPVPAAIWLLGSALFTLIGAAHAQHRQQT